MENDSSTNDIDVPLRRAWKRKSCIVAILIVFACVALAFKGLVYFAGGRAGDLPYYKASELADEITTYRKMHQAWPAWSLDKSLNAYALAAPEDRAKLPDLPTFMKEETSFAKNENNYAEGPPRIFNYWSNDQGYALIWSPGPDRDHDLTMTEINAIFSGEKLVPAAALAAYKEDYGFWYSTGDLYVLLDAKEVDAKH